MTTPTPHGAPELPGLALAKVFHETYERLAPQFGYTTRPETREFDPESANGKLMTAVCAAIQQAAGAVPEGMRLVSIGEGFFLPGEKWSGSASRTTGYLQMVEDDEANGCSIRPIYALAGSPSPLGREAGKEGSSDHLVPCAGGGVTQWQPIETAPKGSGEDGPNMVTHPDYVAPPRLLLATDDGLEVGYYDWYYHAGYGAGAEPGVSAWRNTDGGPIYPTQWMHLPPAPRPDAPTSQIENLDKISTRHCGHPDHPGCEDCTPATREDGDE